MKKVSFVCRVCEKEVETTERLFKKSASMKMTCCSLVCLKCTDEYREKRRRADETRIMKIREAEGFQVHGTKGKITRAKNFLTLHGVAYEHLDEKQIIELWKQEHRKRAGHGQKIRNGQLKKHGCADAVKAANRERVIKACCKKLGFPYRDNFSEDERRAITGRAFANFKVKDTVSWKLKHILRHFSIDDLDNLNSEKIDALYSEYASQRFKRASIESVMNGYTRSEKGWYEMSNQRQEMFFYRSSWEKKVFEALDHMVGMRIISSVCTPERIEYIHENIRRHYYPDAAYVRLDGKIIVLEVKPCKKISDPSNTIKLEAAKRALGDRFHILTEFEIFGDELIETLEKL